MKMITLYTTHCPKCKVLETKLNSKNIEYSEVTDIEVMQEKGFQSAPMLEVDGVVYEFSQANQWINNYTGSKEEVVEDFVCDSCGVN